jgi:hypothetical protein
MLSSSYLPMPLYSMHRTLFLDHSITPLETFLLFSERCLKSTVRDHHLNEEYGRFPRSKRKDRLQASLTTSNFFKSSAFNLPDPCHKQT